MDLAHFKLGLLGHPVKHSISPVIHNAALEAASLSGRYRAYDIAAADLPDWIRAMPEAGFRGVNVTLPHKQTVIALIDELSESARASGAVNTITVVGQKLHGDNTDYLGFLAPLGRLEKLPTSALVLGSGGAARGVLYALGQLSQVGRVVLSARSPVKARKLLTEVVEDPESVTIVSWESRFEAARTAALIVNTTPIGMWPHTADTPLEGADFQPFQTVYDLVYNPRETRLLAEASQAGAACIDGLPMLIGQAAAAFSRWTGREMDLHRVTRAAEQALIPQGR